MRARVRARMRAKVRVRVRVRARVRVRVRVRARVRVRVKMRVRVRVSCLELPGSNASSRIHIRGWRYKLTVELWVEDSSEIVNLIPRRELG